MRRINAEGDADWHDYDYSTAIPALNESVEATAEIELLAAPVEGGGLRVLGRRGLGRLSL